MYRVKIKGRRQTKRRNVVYDEQLRLDQRHFDAMKRYEPTVPPPTTLVDMAAAVAMLSAAAGRPVAIKRDDSDD